MLNRRAWGSSARCSHPDKARCFDTNISDTINWWIVKVKRKYSYSAVGSTVQEDIDAANMGIMAKLKKLQKERLIVARLGFPDKAMEIDEHIEKIRADLRVRSLRSGSIHKQTAVLP